MAEPFLYPELYIDTSLETSGKKASEFLSWFKKELDPFLEAYFAEKIKQAAEIHPEAVVLVEEIRRMVQAGGKRIRPAFAYAAYVASGGHSHEAVLYASSALELWHTFAIIHDDIIDESSLRRGQSTAHTAFDKFHQNRHFPGDSQRFGISAAILAGDLAFSFADELLDSAPFPAERIRRAKIYYNAMKQQTIYGEHLDVISQFKKQISEADVLKILEYKTAKYTIERPMHIGACLAGADEEKLQIFSNYAVPLGQAFQIQDDILGTFGKEENIGKPTDSDIKEGKMTLLIVKAYEAVKPAERKVLDGALGNKKASTRQINQVRKVIENCGSLAYSQKLSNELIERAKEVISEAKLNQEGKNYLLQICNYLLVREPDLLSPK
jgi:geranylgeranyl diphosphate synthase type I